MTFTQVIPWLISIVTGCVALYGIFHKENHDTAVHTAENDTGLKVEIAKQNTKLDMLLNNVGEIRVDQRQHSAKIEELTLRVVKCEESCKSAHKRLDSALEVKTREEE